MAILKDLIVHGSSRFLNKVYTNELETSALEAESAIIKKLKADDATVVGLLDVQGEMHTNSWTNSNIATIDGSFYITPTIGSNSGNIVFSSTNVASLIGDFTAVNSLYIGGSSSGSTVQWTKDSKVLLTGEVKVNNEWLPLGTLLGTLSENAGTSSIGLKELKDNRHEDSSIIIDIRNAVGSTSLECRNLKISLYQRASNSKLYPMGIYMTALGANSKTFIDIYGGVQDTSKAQGGGLTKPNVRIGNLSGLDAVGDISPIGWGIYTTNGYFDGVIVSSAGKIGNFTINSALYSNNHSAWNSNVSGIYINNDGISGGAGGKWWLWNDGSAKIGEMTLSAAGVLTVPAANVSGELTAATINGSKITAGDIAAARIQTNLISAINAKVSDISALTATLGGFQVDSTAIHTKSVEITSNADDSIALSSVDFTRTINNTSRTGLRFAIGDKLGITGDGIIYASSAIISGAIHATSLSTGTKTASTTGKGTFINSDGAIYVGNGSTNNFTVTETGTITATGANLLTATIGNATNKITIGTGTSGHSSIRYGMETLTDLNNNGFYIGTDGIALGKGAFKVTVAGALTATSGSISGGIVTSGIDASNITAGTLSADRIGATSIAIGKLDTSAQTTISNAAKTATTYIAYMNATDGIKVHNANDETNYIQLNSNAISIVKGEKTIAKYSDNIILGDESNVDAADSLLYLNSYSVSLRPASSKDERVFEVSKSLNAIEITTVSSSSSHTYSNISEMSNIRTLAQVSLDGEPLIENTNYTINISGKSITLNESTSANQKLIISYVPTVARQTKKYVVSDSDPVYRQNLELPDNIVDNSIESVTVNGTSTTNYTVNWSATPPVLTFSSSSIPARNAVILVTYQRTTSYFYSLGKRSKSKIGEYSLATGYKCTASGNNSFAGGRFTQVTGDSSIAFGWSQSGMEGDITEVSGGSSGAIGRGIIVNGIGSFSCGRFNQYHSAYRFAVGNGAYGNRKNALTVGQSGNVSIQGRVFSGTDLVDDYRAMFNTPTQITHDNVSISANGNSGTLTINIAKANYTPIAIRGLRLNNASSSGSNASNCFIYAWYISGNNLYCAIHNHGSSAAKIKIIADVFYIASNSI